MFKSKNMVKILKGKTPKVVIYFIITNQYYFQFSYIEICLIQLHLKSFFVYNDLLMYTDTN